MTGPVLTDGDVFGALPTADVVALMELAFEERAAGTLRAPPRWSLDVADGSLVFTVGAATGQVSAMGARIYETVGRGADHTQLVAVFDSETGSFEGVVLGHAIGLLRTGGIGGVAVEHLARADADTVGVLGSGAQARSQLEAIAAVRDLDVARVYSPTREHRDSFAAKLDGILAADVCAVDDAEAAVRDADVLVCATDAAEPVFEADWLAPGAHVSTLGPKFADAHEVPIAVAERADRLVTDSLPQTDSEDRPWFLPTPDRERLIELADVVAGAIPGRTAEDELTLFCSVGLAGTEVVLADEILRRRG
ncbi:MAG: ornithine cyclodeaminase family protein [Haloarculaceae archaeon]